MAPPQLPQLRIIEAPPVPSSAGRRRARAAAAASTSVRRTEGGDHVYALALDAGICEKTLPSLRNLTESLKAPSAGSKNALVASRGKWRFHAEHPNWKSDIRWVSAADEATFRGLFQPLFEKLQIAEHFRSLGEMTLFSGFFVMRRETRKSYFHKDFGDTGGRAFTLMTPLYDMGALPDCHLLCRVPAERPAPAAATLVAAGADAAVDGGHCEEGGGDAGAEEAGAAEPLTKQYRYRLGEAIVFGDGFEHATQTGTAPHMLAFLCFTFGDRRCTEEQWAAAEAYIREQGPVWQRPDGRLVLNGS